MICINGEVRITDDSRVVALLEDGRIYPLMSGDGPYGISGTKTGLVFSDQPIKISRPRRGQKVILVHNDDEKFQFWTFAQWVEKAASHEVLATEVQEPESADWSPGVGELQAA